MFISIPFVVHNKTGSKYTALVIDAIDCRNGTHVVVYTDGNKTFIEDSKEFFEEFSQDVYPELNKAYLQDFLPKVNTSC